MKDRIKKWLINGSTTLAIVLFLISAFILINTGMQKLELTPIDLTSEKTYTVTEESKEKVSKLEKKVNIYLVGYTDDSSATTLAKQYNKANNNINIEAVDITTRTDLAQKYGISSSETKGIIVECGEKNKVLTDDDLYTYDTTTYDTIDITEEKLTSAILTVTADSIPNIYFLTGYSDFSLSNGMSYLSAFLENEIMEVKELDLVSKQNVPDDCNTLVITTPNKDFPEIVSNAIIKYINNGGNILWLNTSYGIEKKLPNVNKVLEIYGIEPFEVGYIMETNSDKMLSGAPYMVLPDVQYSDITSKINTVLFVEPAKIKIKEESKLKDLNVEMEELLTTSEESFYRTDLKENSETKTEKDTPGEYITGAKLTKKISEDKKSILVIYADNYFISDTQVTQSSQTPILLVYDNKDLIVKTLTYLTDREDSVTIRKNTDYITYTATEMQDTIIRVIIFVVPCLIILVGIIVWQIRRRKK